MAALRNFNGLASWRNAENSLQGTSKNDAAGVNPDVPCGLPDSGQV